MNQGATSGVDMSKVAMIGDNVIDRLLRARHWLMLLAGILFFSLAWLAVAEEAADEWGAWNQLPDDMLEMTDETSGLPLSQRLDQLAREEQWERVESVLPEQALSRWLGQWSPHGAAGHPMPAQSLDELFQQLPAPVTPPGPPDNRPPTMPGNAESSPAGPPESSPGSGSSNRPDVSNDRGPGRP